MPIVKRDNAITAGLFPLTSTFLRSEDHLLESCVSSLGRGGILYCLVETADGHEVWRAKSGAILPDGWKN